MVLSAFAAACEMRAALRAGPYLEDRTPLRFAALVAREWGGFTPPPGYRT